MWQCYLSGKIQMKVYKITPIPKPRMNQKSSKFSKAAKKYWAFKDKVRGLNITVPESGGRILFVLPMAKSWSKKKRFKMDSQPHKQRPDVDNMLKALLDSVFDEDAHIWDIHVTKIWGKEGRIVIGENRNVLENKIR